MAAERATAPLWTLSFHGSEISRAWLSEDHALHIVLSAAAAIPSDHADRTDLTKRVEGYLSGVTLVLSSAQGQVGQMDQMDQMGPSDDQLDDQIGDSAPSQPTTTQPLTEPALSLVMGGLAEGHVTAQGQLLRQLPAPGHQAGPLTLNLRLISGTSLSASGHSLRIELAPFAVFRESWAC